VTNLQVTEAVIGDGFYYAPDPSSQQVCTIGGNVAENSGGAHCLKYGFTVNHVLGLLVVLPDGETVRLSADTPGPDLLGVFVGSEGTLGIATEITLRLLRRPEAVRTVLAAFDSTDGAGSAVSGIVSVGILASAMEIMDRLTIEAAEAAVHPGYPDANALLLVELDGPTPQVEEDLAAVEAICRDCGAWEIRTAADDHERALLWKGRKSAFAAMGRVSSDYYVQDGVVPRTKLPEVLRRIAELEGEFGLRVGNVFHAGDGNLHPLVLYDARVEGEPERARALAEAILEACIDAGGSLTGEHGIGVDKACSMPLLFGADDLEAMQRVRRAFDPAGLCNPGKVFPTPRLCGEVPGPYRAHPLEKAGLAERL
jgi:glycolate oxidase